jgi:hypothetical protein
MNQARKPKQDQEDRATIDKWQTDFTEAVTVELHRQIKQQEGVYGVEFADKLRLSIIASCISTFLYEALSGADGDLESSVDPAHFVFEDAREAVEMAVISGIEGAVRASSGKELQYYCKILPEPEALNKQDC